MPICLVLGLMVVAPGYMQGLASDPLGKWLIGGAVVLQLIGNFVIRKIINIKV
jgi:tight adherence protein B